MIQAVTFLLTYRVHIQPSSLPIDNNNKTITVCIATSAVSDDILLLLYVHYFSKLVVLVLHLVIMSVEEALIQ